MKPPKRPWGAEKVDPIDAALDGIDEAIEAHRQARERAARVIERTRLGEEQRHGT